MNAEHDTCMCGSPVDSICSTHAVVCCWQCHESAFGGCLYFDIKETRSDLAEAITSLEKWLSSVYAEIQEHIEVCSDKSTFDRVGNFFNTVRAEVNDIEEEKTRILKDLVSEHRGDVRDKMIAICVRIKSDLGDESSVTHEEVTTPSSRANIDLTTNRSIEEMRQRKIKLQEILNFSRRLLEKSKHTQEAKAFEFHCSSLVTSNIQYLLKQCDVVTRTMYQPPVIEMRNYDKTFPMRRQVFKIPEYNETVVNSLSSKLDTAKLAEVEVSYEDRPEIADTDREVVTIQKNAATTNLDRGDLYDNVHAEEREIINDNVWVIPDITDTECDVETIHVTADTTNLDMVTRSDNVLAEGRGIINATVGDIPEMHVADNKSSDVETIHVTPDTTNVDSDDLYDIVHADGRVIVTTTVGDIPVTTKIEVETIRVSPETTHLDMDATYENEYADDREIKDAIVRGITDIHIADTESTLATTYGTADTKYLRLERDHASCSDILEQHAKVDAISNTAHQEPAGKRFQTRTRFGNFVKSKETIHMTADTSNLNRVTSDMYGTASICTASRGVVEARGSEVHLKDTVHAKVDTPNVHVTKEATVEDIPYVVTKVMDDTTRVTEVGEVHRLRGLVKDLCSEIREQRARVDGVSDTANKEHVGKISHTLSRKFKSVHSRKPGIRDQIPAKLANDIVNSASTRAASRRISYQGSEPNSVRDQMYLARTPSRDPIIISKRAEIKFTGLQSRVRFVQREDSTGNSFLLTTWFPDRLALVDTNGKTIGNVDLADQPYDACALNDEVYVTLPNLNQVSVYTESDLKLVTSFATTLPCRSISLRCGDLITICKYKIVQLITTRGVVLRKTSYKFKNAARAIAAESGEEIYVSDTKADSICVFSGKLDKLLRVISGHLIKSPMDFCLLEDTLLVCCADTQTLVCVDSRDGSGKELSGARKATSVSYSPNNRSLLVVHDGGAQSLVLVLGVSQKGGVLSLHRTI